MIDILLATFNGGKHVAAQIDSLLKQTHADWRLLIRDDASTDDTVAVCLEYAARHPGRIRLLQDDLGRLKVPGNHGELLRQSTAGYVMFCDQDDVWMPDKIEKTLAAMRRLEREAGPDTPLLVHTDSRVCDENLRAVADSLLKYLNRKPNLPLNRLCVEDPVYGHTVMINEPLKKLYRGFPEGVVVHDWFLALVATAFGRVLFLDEPTVLFRRHASTTTGTTRHSLLGYFNHSMSDYRRKANRNLRQCEVFYEMYGTRLNPRHRKLLAAAARIRQSNWLTRRYLVLRHGMFKTGWIKNAGWLASV